MKRKCMILIHIIKLNYNYIILNIYSNNGNIKVYALQSYFNYVKSSDTHLKCLYKQNNCIYCSSIFDYQSSSMRLIITKHHLVHILNIKCCHYCIVISFFFFTIIEII